MTDNRPTYILLTVGMNPLPCLVAAYRLCCFYRKDAGRPLTLVMVHSAEATHEAAGIKEALDARLDSPVRTDNWQVSDPYSPDEIIRTAMALADHYKDPQAVFHVHYTGGTKAMGVHIVESLLRRGRSVETSYLDPRRHRVVSSSTTNLDSLDERSEWALDVHQLSVLHDIRTWDRKPGADVAQISAALFAVLGKNDNGVEFSKFRKRYVGYYGKPELKDPRPSHLPKPEKGPIDWPSMGGDLEWHQATAQLSRLFSGNHLWRVAANNTWQLDFTMSQAGPYLNNLKQLNRVIDGGILEFAAYRNLQLAFKELGYGALPVHHSLEGRIGGKQFEVDVAAVIGYQLLFISCTMSTDVKLKAFEVHRRAQQLGGDQSRAILLCMQVKEDAEQSQLDAKDDIGVTENLIEVWGIDKMQDLKGSFVNYLKAELNLQP